MKPKLLIVTHNPAKLQEYRTIFAAYRKPYTLVSLSDIGIHKAAEEVGDTFQDNALIKAEFASLRAPLPLLAEDGGFEIMALGGEPGVHTRRWLGGRETSDEALVQTILERLKGKPLSERGAQFRVVVVFRASYDAMPKITEGVQYGYITEEPVAALEPGFPFRSIFRPSHTSSLWHPLYTVETEEISHRKIAVEKLLPTIQETLGA